MNGMAYFGGLNEGLRELALFAGAGGGILGGNLLGWRTVCAVEWEPYPAAVLAQRQNDGILPPFPIWDDVRTFDGRPWRGIGDVVSGGFPCQPFSAAGRQLRERDPRNMWPDTARIIGEVRPRYAFLENVPGLTVAQKLLVICLERVGQMDLFGKADPLQIMSRLRRIVRKIVGRSYFGRILGDLSEMGYDAQWGVVSAADAGAPHLRERIWILATDSDSQRVRKQPGRIGWENGPREAELVDHGEELADTSFDGREQGRPESARTEGRFEIVKCGSWWAIDPATVPHYWLDTRRWSIPNANGKSKRWATEPRCKRRFRIPVPYVGRVAHGVAARVDRLKAIGNGQVPAVARLAWETLTRGT